MNVGNLVIPDEIQLLIDREIWPKNSMEMQELKPFFSEDIVQKIAPEMSVICFASPPFSTIKNMIDKGDYFWLDPNIDNSSVDLALVVDIGDFGMGTDTSIALDYSKNIFCPSVIRLEWYKHNPDNPNITKARWVKISDSFSEFCRMLEIDL